MANVTSPLFWQYTFAHCFLFWLHAHCYFYYCYKHTEYTTMKCLECSDETKKYKCTRCELYWWVFLFQHDRNVLFNFGLIDFSCSFDCFKKHKNADCTPAKTESQEKSVGKTEVLKPILQFTTEDSVDPEKLAQLGMCISMNSTWFHFIEKNQRFNIFIGC